MYRSKIYVLLDIFCKVFDFKMKLCFMFLVEVLCFINSFVYLKFFVLIVMFKGEDFFEFCIFMVVVFLRRILVLLIRFFDMVLCRGKIFFMVKEFRFVFLILISFNSFGSCFFLRFVL